MGKTHCMCIQSSEIIASYTIKRNLASCHIVPVKKLEHLAHMLVLEIAEIEQF